MLLLSDRRVLELKNARGGGPPARPADRRADAGERRAARSQIDAANRHEFPAEKVAREELHLVSPDDLVLLYPPGSLSGPDGQKPAPAPPAAAKKPPTR